MTEEIAAERHESKTMVLPGWDDPMVRRGFLGFMGKVGLAAIGATSGLIGFSRRADAAMPCTCDPPNFACCSLNYNPPNCPLDSGGFPYCPSGTIAYVWHCCFCNGSRTYACMECTYTTGNGTCCQGLSNTRCSAAWTTSRNTCNLSCNPSCGCDGQTKGCLN